MITWWNCTTYIIPIFHVSCFSLSWVNFESCTVHSNLLSALQDYISYDLYISFLNIGNLVTNQSYILQPKSNQSYIFHSWLQQVQDWNIQSCHRWWNHPWLYHSWQSTTNCFCGIFVGIPQHQKGYLIYVPSTQKIVSSHKVVFEETFSSALAYTSHPYSESLSVRQTVSYVTYATLSHWKTGNIIPFARFEDGNLVEKYFSVEEDKSVSDSMDALFT